jgi:hypothetical protein
MKRQLRAYLVKGDAYHDRVQIMLRTTGNQLWAEMTNDQAECIARDLLVARFDTHPPTIFQRPKKKRAGHQDVWLMAKFRE